ncbi:MAG: flavodoxin domain-containing protein [Lachnospiraceae bacterium]
MKTAVIYTSKTGFTKRYAQWIAEGAQADCLDWKQAKKLDFSDYDAIIYGGWVCAATVRHLDWFRSHLSQWPDKRLIVFAVGASPVDSPDIRNFMDQTFGSGGIQGVNAFYCPGGLSYENMSVPARIMMRLFVKSVANKKDKTPYEAEAARMMAHSYDISDPKYITPILELLHDCDEPASETSL